MAGKIRPRIVRSRRTEGGRWIPEHVRVERAVYEPAADGKPGRTRKVTIGSGQPPGLDSEPPAQLLAKLTDEEQAELREWWSEQERQQAAAYERRQVIRTPATVAEVATVLARVDPAALPEDFDPAALRTAMAGLMKQTDRLGITKKKSPARRRRPSTAK